MNFLNKLNLLNFLPLMLLHAKMGSSGKTATRAGLTGITQVRASSMSYDTSLEDVDTVLAFSARQANRSSLSYLKFTLMQLQGYDKAIRPVLDKEDSVSVEIDITYKQVLNLNEKQQTLTSLLYYRLYWKDAFLTWKPEDYDGIENIWLPANSIWMPDVVCNEETGARDFNPRIPFVVVHYDGTVRYLEPTALQTTCEIKIAYFPFDIQICNLTFASWTLPTSILDLSARRPTSAYNEDIKTYFSDSGEWMLLKIDVEKISTSYLHLASDLESQKNYTEEELEIMMRPFFVIPDPQLTVAEVMPSRTAHFHWSDVRYTVVFRRNSLSYIQSMLFPAILLTTISILGFYLPPESGERIGLQITILLTFMVFILTVGDMFPASTGPYLGVYFVLCMALLGLNIIMTVLVLHLHHIPCKLILMVDPITGESRSNLRILPYWIKLGMILTGVYDDLKTFAIPAEKPSNKGINEKKTMLGNILKKWKASSQSRVDIKKDLFPVTISNNNVDSKRVSFSTIKSKPLPSFRSPLKNGKLNRNRKGDFSFGHAEDDSDFHRNTSVLADFTSSSTISENSPSYKIVSQNWKENLLALNKIMTELSEMSKNLSSITVDSQNRDSSAKHKNAETAMEEKWKAVARKVDFHCMVAYITIMILFHVTIALVVAYGA